MQPPSCPTRPRNILSVSRNWCRLSSCASSETLRPCCRMSSWRLWRVSSGSPWATYSRRSRSSSSHSWINLRTQQMISTLLGYLVLLICAISVTKSSISICSRIRWVCEQSLWCTLSTFPLIWIQWGSFRFATYLPNWCRSCTIESRWVRNSLNPCSIGTKLMTHSRGSLLTRYQRWCRRT